jgi:hypothetical protein
LVHGPSISPVPVHEVGGESHGLPPYIVFCATSKCILRAKLDIFGCSHRYACGAANGSVENGNLCIVTAK